MAQIDIIYQKLKEIQLPTGDPVSLGLVRNLSIENRKVSFTLTVPKSLANSLTKERVIAKIKELPEIEDVEVDVQVTEDAPAQIPIQVQIPQAIKERIRKVLMVTSGKGGVGKSTVAANLAVAFAKMGKRVGLLDGDIYGPSIPKIFGIEQYSLKVVNNRIIPVTRYGVKVLSIGLLVTPDQPIVWRGPMVHKAYQQFLNDVEWGTLDILVLDLPPGTGDPQLSAAQIMPIQGGIAVTTPQDVSLSDVRRAIYMMEKVGVRVLGIVENMSYLICPHCGHKISVFGEGGGTRLAQETGVELLGQVPLDPAVVAASDQGQPPVAMHPDSPVAQAFSEIAERVWAKLETPVPTK